MQLKKIRPLSITDFPNISTNCFGFALGIENPVDRLSYDYDLNHQLPIADAFLQKLSELGFANLPRQIHNVEEAKESEYIFKIFDFIPVKGENWFDKDLTYWHYHVTRRELDGTWVHKPGWREQPCVILDTDWPKIEEEFGSKYVLFALEASE